MEDSIHSAAHSDDEDKVQKRKRQTLSCLQCKKRKTKCDKTQPCSTCRARNEAHICVYDDGAAPPPEQSFVSLDQFIELKARFEKLEALVASSPGVTSLPSIHHNHSLSSSHNSPYSRSSPHSTFVVPPIRERISSSDKVELAFEELETVAIATSDGTLHMTSAADISGPALYQSRPVGPHGISGGDDNSNTTSIFSPLETVAGRSDKWKRKVIEMVDAIPSKEKLELLLDSYFSNICYRPLTHPYKLLFQQEITQYLSASKRQHLLIDPAWLALLYSILAAGANSLLQDALPLPRAVEIGLTHDNLNELLSIFMESYDSALSCADFMYRPQLRNLLAMIICLPLVVYGRHVTNRSMSELRHMRIIQFESAVGIAKALRLHRLGSDPMNLPPSDPLLPDGNHVLRRQFGCRLFHTLLFLDSLSNCASAAGFGTEAANYVFVAGSWDTAEPLNYDDDEVVMGTKTKLVVRSPYTLTPAMFDIHRNRMGRYMREVALLLNDTESVDYESTVLQLDREIRDALEDITNLKLGNQATESQIIILDGYVSGYCQRVLRLHRPFLLRSYRDQKYLYSRKQALQSARQIMIIHRNMIQHQAFRPEVQQTLYLFVHHLSAIIVLFVDGLYDRSSMGSARDEITESEKAFYAVSSSFHPHFAKAAKHASAVSRSLLEALANPPPTEKMELVLKSIRHTSLHNPPTPSASEISMPQTTTPDALILPFNPNADSHPPSHHNQKQIIVTGPSNGSGSSNGKANTSSNMVTNPHTKAAPVDMTQSILASLYNQDFLGGTVDANGYMYNANMLGNPGSNFIENYNGANINGLIGGAGGVSSLANVGAYQDWSGYVPFTSETYWPNFASETSGFNVDTSSGTTYAEVPVEQWDWNGLLQGL